MAGYILIIARMRLRYRTNYVDSAALDSPQAGRRGSRESHFVD